jgi:hypothetical protein
MEENKLSFSYCNEKDVTNTHSVNNSLEKYVLPKEITLCYD